MRENKKLLFSIISVFLLVIVIIGGTYAYYNALVRSESVNNNTAKADLSLTINKLSTGASSSLIPISESTNVLTAAAKGYGNSGSTFDSTKSCIDKNGHSVCQIYEVIVTNTGTVGLNINGGVTSLSGTNTPNISCTKMSSSVSVSSISSCTSSTSLANNTFLDANSSNTYYIMVYVKDTNVSQSDSGPFNGTITFTSANSRIEAVFN